MADTKSSAKGWIIGILIVILIAVGAYLFIKNRASADVATSSTGGYKFEVLSNKTLTVQKTSANHFRILEPVYFDSGIGVRVRRIGSNQIVSNPKWIVDNTMGFFAMNKDNSLVGVYPTSNNMTSSLSAQVGSTSIFLDFSPTGYTISPTPRPIVSPSRTPVVIPSPGGTANDTVLPYTPTPGRTASDVVPLPSPASTGACYIDSSGRQICS